MLQGALALGARVIELSVASALKLIRSSIEAVRCGLPSAGLVARFRLAVRDQYVRGSPKRARAWSHKKNETPPRPPKLRRPTTQEKDRICVSLRQYGTPCG